MSMCSLIIEGKTHGLERRSRTPRIRQVVVISLLGLMSDEFQDRLRETARFIGFSAAPSVSDRPLSAQRRGRAPC
jgi:hypothetical protein